MYVGANLQPLTSPKKPSLFRGITITTTTTTTTTPPQLLQLIMRINY